MARSLDAPHEARFRLFLDEQLAHLERDVKKHQLQLAPLIPRLKALLGVILALPSQLADTRAAYFLTYTSLVIDSTTELPLLVLPAEAEPGSEEAASVEDQAGQIMEDYLALLDLVDSAWMSILTGEGWHTPKRFLQALYGDDGPLTVELFRGSIGHPRSTPSEASASEGTSERRQPEIDATSQIRLKSILQLAREKVLAWARPYGDFGGEVLGPSGDEGREVTAEERDGWEGCVLRLFSKPIALIDRLQAFDPAAYTQAPLRLPEYAIPPAQIRAQVAECEATGEATAEADGEDEDEDEMEMEEVQV